MAIRLTFDVTGSTCGDLLRFADAVRAAGAQPEQPLQQSSGPNHIDVVVDDGRVTGPYPSPPHGPGPHPHMPPPQLHRPGGPIHHGPFGPPGYPGPPGPPGAGFVMSGSFPPGFYRGGSRWEERPGAFIGVSWGGRSRGTDVPLDTVERWKVALDTVLGSATVEESVKASLRRVPGRLLIIHSR
jgi:hypothetical protein